MVAPGIHKSLTERATHFETGGTNQEEADHFANTLFNDPAA